MKVSSYMMEICTENGKEMFKANQHYQNYNATQAGQKLTCTGIRRGEEQRASLSHQSIQVLGDIFKRSSSKT